jgi:hypothetical protein
VIVSPAVTAVVPALVVSDVTLGVLVTSRLAVADP